MTFRARAGSAAVLFVSTIAVGCGGKVLWSPDGAGGDSSTGSTSSKSASSVAVGGSSTTGGGPTCMDIDFGGIGQKCAQEGQSCVMPFSCCSGSAICKNGVWTAQSVACAQACIPCGPSGFACQANAVCVNAQFEFAVTYQCLGNPCVASPLSCSCASAVCEQNSLSCAGTSDPGQVFCDCPNCDSGG